MKIRFAILLSIFMSLTAAIHAQLPPQRQASPEAKQRSRDKAEYGALRKQIAALKEFADEKKKIPKLQKDNKETVKVLVTVDSVETDDTSLKTLTGYITQQIGETSNNAYEITFDRAQRKIIAVKRTGESAEPEPKEKATPAKKATTTKAAPKKKTKDGDEEDEEEDEKEEKEEKDVKDKGNG